MNKTTNTETKPLAIGDALCRFCPVPGSVTRGPRGKVYFPCVFCGRQTNRKVSAVIRPLAEAVRS